MTSARVAGGMRKHFLQVLEVWGGKEANHIKVTETIDEQGNTISIEEDAGTTISGIISVASYQEKYYPVGALMTGDLTAFFLYNDDNNDVIKSKQLTPNTIRHDIIEYGGVRYLVEQIAEIARDVAISSSTWEPIFARYQLRKISED